MIFDSDDIKNAFLRLGRSKEAPMLLQHLQSVMLSVTGSGVEAGAVKYSEGRRSLALELIQMMEFEPTNDGNATDLAGKRPQPISVRPGRLRRVSGDADAG